MYPIHLAICITVKSRLKTMTKNKSRPVYSPGLHHVLADITTVLVNRLRGGFITRDIDR